MNPSSARKSAGSGGSSSLNLNSDIHPSSAKAAKKTATKTTGVRDDPARPVPVPSNASRLQRSVNVPRRDPGTYATKSAANSIASGSTARTVNPTAIRSVQVDVNRMRVPPNAAPGTKAAKKTGVHDEARPSYSGGLSRQRLLAGVSMRAGRASNERPHVPFTVRKTVAGSRPPPPSFSVLSRRPAAPGSVPMKSRPISVPWKDLDLRAKQDRAKDPSRRSNVTMNRMANPPRITTSAVKRRSTASSGRGANLEKESVEKLPAVVVISKDEIRPAEDFCEKEEENDEEELRLAPAKPSNQLARKSAARPLGAAMKVTSVLAPRSRSLSPIPSSSSTISPSSFLSVAPPQRLREAVKCLVLNPPSMPFLRRNLRKTFRSRYPEFSNPSHSGSGQEMRAFKVKFRLCSDADDGGLEDEDGIRTETFVMFRQRWTCPLCDCFGVFDTKAMLSKHIGVDHMEVGVLWFVDEHVDRGDNSSLLLSVPEPGDETASFNLSSSSESSDEDEQTEGVVKPEPTELSLTPAESSIDNIIDVDACQIIPEEMSKRLKFKFVPPPSSSVTRSGSSTAVSPAASSRHLSFSSPSQTRSSSPSSIDPLGPQRPYPYLPYGSVMYSCRPGGPKLYDLLSDLPLDRFGVMGWFIIDKEEEIFDLIDVRDEDKVMMALWSRWIFFNRISFLADYSKGVMAFIDEYHEMINIAAGWHALRIWLVTLMANRFLEGSEVVNILLYYERCVGIPPHTVACSY